MILAIYGAGGFGREVFELAKQIDRQTNKWDNIIFVDDIRKEKIINNTIKYTFDEFVKQYSTCDAKFIIALGEPRLRKDLFFKVNSYGYDFETLIHPSIYLSDHTQLGRGVVVGSNAFISCNCLIEDNVVIQQNSQVCHDTIIKESCVISSYSVVCGQCIIGEETFLGVQSSVRENTTVGSKCIIGMGSVVVKDIPNNVIAIGNPSKIIRNNNGERIFK